MGAPPSQPPGAPPAEWTPRTDAGARKVVDEMQRLREELKKLEAKVEAVDKKQDDQTKDLGEIVKKLGGHVSWPFIVTLGLAIVGAAWKLSTDGAREAKESVEKSRAGLSADIREVRAESAAKVDRIEAKTDGIYRLLVEGQPKRDVQQVVKQKEARIRALEAAPKPAP